MTQMLAEVALCLLGILAAVSGNIAKPGALERGPPLPQWPYNCGFCYGNQWAPLQVACYRWRRYCTKWVNMWPQPRCLRWVWYTEAFCCNNGILFYFPFYGTYVCYNKYYGGCGGFLGGGFRTGPCVYKGMKICGPSYRLHQSKCVKESHWTPGRAVKGTAVRVTTNPRKIAKLPPPNVKDGMMITAPREGLGKPKL